jgi:CCR4-NOT transcription complex subunit 4
MTFAELSKLRVIQRNLVYVIGLAPQMANKDILEKYEYFGQYGQVSKSVVNKLNAYNPGGPNGPSYSAYLTFQNEMDASTAILVIK